MCGLSKFVDFDKSLNEYQNARIMAKNRSGNLEESVIDIADLQEYTFVGIGYCSM